MVDKKAYQVSLPVCMAKTLEARARAWTSFMLCLAIVVS